MGFDRHDPHCPIHANHSNAIVAHSADDSGDVRAVPAVVNGIGIVIYGVDAIDIVYVPIAVVVDLVRCFIVAVRVCAGFSRVTPHVCVQIFVVVIDTQIDHGDHYTCGTSSRIPRLRCFDDHWPIQFIKTRIVRYCVCVINEVGLDCDYAGQRLEPADGIGKVRSCRQPNLGPVFVEFAQRLGACLRQYPFRCRLFGSAVEFDQEFILDILAAQELLSDFARRSVPGTGEAKDDEGNKND